MTTRTWKVWAKQLLVVGPVIPLAAISTPFHVLKWKRPYDFIESVVPFWMHLSAWPQGPLYGPKSLKIWRQALEELDWLYAQDWPVEDLQKIVDRLNEEVSQ